MKQVTVILILAAGLLAGCRNHQLKPDQARILGTFSPAIPGYLHISAGPVLDSAQIKSNGEFGLTIPLTEPMRALLFIGNRLSDVYLEPGKEVILTINSIVFPEKITYSGELGPINHYLSLAKKLDQQSAIGAHELYSMEPLNFIRFTDSIRLIKSRLLNEYEARYQEIDSGFVNQTHADIEFWWAGQHLQYPDNYLAIKGIPPILPEGYHFNYRDSLHLNSISNLGRTSYQEFVQKYLDFRESVYLTEHPSTQNLLFPRTVARFRVIHEEFTDPDIVDYLLFTAMDDHLANFGTTKVESFMTDFRISCKNQQYISIIEGIVASLENVGIGKPAPDFTAYTISGEKVNLSDYFGQLLYIGFWASWSEWSLKEIPYFEQLRSDFEFKPVKFIMISLDFEKDKNRWAAIIEKNKFGSIQLIEDPKSNVLKEKYFLNDFPRYFLIDQEGKIISVFAPGPTENIAETLDRILRLPKKKVISD